MHSRRKFLQSTFLLTAGICSGALDLLKGYSASASDLYVDNKQKYVLADIHNHIMLNEWLKHTPVGVKSPMLADFARDVFDKTITTWKSSYEAGIDMICVAHFNPFDEWVTMPLDPNPTAPENTFRMMDLLESEVEGPSSVYAKMIKTPVEFKNHFNPDYKKENSKYRVAVIHSLEGGHALGGSLDPIKKFAQRGVVLITIGHFFNKGIATAPNALPFFPDANSIRPNQGLSEFGINVIREMEKQGIIVDVTHATSTAMDDILNFSTKPLIATHISARTLGDHAYSFYDEHIQEIVRRGGMIGIPIYPYMLSNYANINEAVKHGSLSEVVRTIRYVVKITGSTKNVCIGSDFGAYLPGLNDMNCLCQVEILRDKLIDEFSDAEVVQDILAKNVIEFIKNNWNGKS